MRMMDYLLILTFSQQNMPGLTVFSTCPHLNVPDLKRKERQDGTRADHGSVLTRRRLVLSIFITVVFVFGEAIAGYISHSLALMSDAGHNFADSLALVFTWYGIWVARKPSTAKRTFGYHRVGILAALVNSVSLIAIALLIFWEAIDRLRHPEPVRSTPMIVVALIAVLMNTVISLWLRSGAKKDLNVRSAYIHMFGDAISAAGVVVAGVIVALTGASIADPVVSATGLGATISQATDAGDFTLLLASTITMAVLVVTINRLVWRRLYRLAEARFKLES